MSSTLSANVQKLVDHNTIFASTFTPLPNMKEYAASVAANPDLPRICIITCADPRVIPERIFGLDFGDAIVVRVAGGNLAPALGTMLAIDSLSGFTDVVMMRHTDCGTGLWTDERIRESIEGRTAVDHAALVGRRGEKLSEVPFCESVGDMEALLREDVGWLKNSPVVREGMKERIVGMMYEVETGKAKVIC